MNWQLSSATALRAHQPSRRMFFFHEDLPRGARNIHHAYAPVEKLGTVLVDESEARRHVAAFCGTLLRLDDGRYRLYYTTWDRRTMRIAIAESPDGLAWEKVPLGQENRPGFEDNMIVFSGVPSEPVAAHAPEVVAADGRRIDQGLGINRQDQVGQPQVVRLPDGTWRMYYWHHQHGWGRVPYLYTVAESNDGLRWHVPDYTKPALNSPWLGDQSSLTDAERMAEKARRTNDANFVYRNPWLGCYEQFSQWFLDAPPERRVAEDNCPDFSRVIQRRTSEDGLAWNAPQIVIQPDEHDPWDQQFYHLAVQYHEDWYIGSLGHYRVEQGQQNIVLALAFSRDGRTWHRPVRGSFIPRDPDGPDRETISPANAWIDEGDTWLCLYNGVARKHNEHGRDDLPVTRIMAGRWPKNRFVGLAADRVTGGFLSDVFYPQGPEIVVDADIRGWLRAELCDAWGRKHEGYHLMDSVVIQGDNTAHRLLWKESSAARFAHDPVRIRFEYADGVVYGLHF